MYTYVDGVDRFVLNKLIYTFFITKKGETTYMEMISK